VPGSKSDSHADILFGRAMTEQPDHTFCIAPMMEWTDRHCRFFLRQISRHCLLYTEMVTAHAVLHGDRRHLLGFDPVEHPVALQLGGSDPATLAAAARIGEQTGYDEINLNLGCPSDRVQYGRFGACLMTEPATVAACVTAMARSVDVPVTVKTRIGVDDHDSYAELAAFIRMLAGCGCRTVIVHARKAFLQGLSPKENRTVPQLRYERVYRLKSDFPELEIVINGGVKTLAEVRAHLEHVDGVMLGREAYHNPWILAGVDAGFFRDSGAPPAREAVIDRMLPYIDRELNQGNALKHITRHMLGLYQGVPGARAWRRYLSEHAYRAGADSTVLLMAREAVGWKAGGETPASGELQQHG
jgi:tRNA-dihydrouridine synthase A